MKHFLPGLILLAAVCQAQDPGPVPAKFDVASIKPNNSGSGSEHESDNNGTLHAVNLDLRSLLQSAFGVRDFQLVNVPAWADGAHYDIEAKIIPPRTLTDKQTQSLFLSLLEERFALKFHRDSREMPGFSLAATRSGPKLTTHQGEEKGVSTHTSSDGPRVTMEMTGCSLPCLAERLERRIGQPVADGTGIPGTFDMKLEFSRDQNTDSSLPTIYTALTDQLGLRLESKKVPVEMIVVDHIEPPTEN